MKLTGVETVTVCPWAIREGVLLRHIEDGAAWWSELTELSDESGPVRTVPLRIATPTT
jgi:exopolyphosphatase/guanosine-5'-triphosphate,3'-diphosphate pyrophosphatase